jgi:translation initiation factor 1 (eIF-1/SUI1)
MPNIFYISIIKEKENPVYTQNNCTNLIKEMNSIVEIVNKQQKQKRKEIMIVDNMLVSTVDHPVVYVQLIHVIQYRFDQDHY